MRRSDEEVSQQWTRARQQQDAGDTRAHLGWRYGALPIKAIQKWLARSHFFQFAAERLQTRSSRSGARYF